MIRQLYKVYLQHKHEGYELSWYVEATGDYTAYLRAIEKTKKSGFDTDLFALINIECCS
jgi:hypothetical protein